MYIYMQYLHRYITISTQVVPFSSLKWCGQKHDTCAKLFPHLSWQWQGMESVFPPDMLDLYHYDDFVFLWSCRICQPVDDCVLLKTFCLASGESSQISYGRHSALIYLDISNNWKSLIYHVLFLTLNTANEKNTHFLIVLHKVSYLFFSLSYHHAFHCLISCLYGLIFCSFLLPLSLLLSIKWRSLRTSKKQS